MPIPKLPRVRDVLPEAPFEALSLPQDDPHPERRQKQLIGAQDAYEYTYAKPNLRGIAMCAKLPVSEAPTPSWVLATAQTVARLGVNALAQRDAVDHPESDSDVESVQRSLVAAGRDGPKVALEHAEALARPDVIEGRAGQLADFARLFQTCRVPDVASELHLDSTFARLRVAGSNPAWMRQVDPRDGLPSDFGVTAEHYRAAMGRKDSLEAALKEGRLFLCEYRELLGLTPGSDPVPPKIEVDYDKDPQAWDAAYKAREAAYATSGTPKHLTAPLALFTVPKGGRSLAPVAIQLFPNGWQDRTYPIFTPRDGAAWHGAKACVQMADGNVHEAISHLGLTHLVQEAFSLAMHNCLAPRHPLNRLLEPHFQGTTLINTAADASLVSPEGSVDKLLGATIGGTIGFAAKARNDWSFNASIFPRSLENRGVADSSVLPDYPYRDDGLLVWRAMESWVRDYVHHYYPTDAHVLADIELQSFVHQVGQYQVKDGRGRIVGGGVKGVGEDGPQVFTRDYLTQMLTQSIWNGSAQHAAVNFPQADLMAYAPAYPLYNGGPWPSVAQDFTDADYLRQMPSMEIANLQLSVGVLLGGVHATQLGHYGKRGPAPWFTDTAIRGYARSFSDALSHIEETLIERNRARPRYTHLLPSMIPQSIDI